MPIADLFSDGPIVFGDGGGDADRSIIRADRLHLNSEGADRPFIYP